MKVVPNDELSMAEQRIAPGGSGRAATVTTTKTLGRGSNISDGHEILPAITTQQAHQKSKLPRRSNPSWLAGNCVENSGFQTVSSSILLVRAMI
jgi:hypothetical protein